MSDHNPQPVPKAKRSTVTACPWPVCTRCGLIYTKAPAARAAARQPCPGKDDPPEKPA